MKGEMRIAAAALLASLVLVLGLTGAASGGSSSRAAVVGIRTVTVSGSGTASAVPHRAQSPAAASHAKLGPVRSVSESSAGPPPPLAPTAKAGPSDSTPVEPGTQTIEADVVVQFTLG